MAREAVINVDLADVWADADRKSLVRTLAWGDGVKVVSQTDAYVEVEFRAFREERDGSVLPTTASGYIVPTPSSGLDARAVTIPKNQNKVLRVNFVDVQQGDGAVIESPSGKVDGLA